MEITINSRINKREKRRDKKLWSFENVLAVIASAGTHVTN
jgi:hypothetical protein